jgi:hypothetical protein
MMMMDLDDYVNDQDQMLMMIVHYMDMREARKKIHHPLLMDWYQIEVENSFKKKRRLYLSPHGYTHALS